MLDKLTNGVRVVFIVVGVHVACRNSEKPSFAKGKRLAYQADLLKCLCKLKFLKLSFEERCHIIRQAVFDVQVLGGLNSTPFSVKTWQKLVIGEPYSLMPKIGGPEHPSAQKLDAYPKPSLFTSYPIIRM
jgi:hypothetical protein